MSNRPPCPLVLNRSTAWAGLLLALALPGSSAAQSEPASSALPRFDITASTGWFGSDTRNLPGEVYRTWDLTGVGNVSLGVYWTEHFKTELDLGVSGEQELYGSEALETTRNTSRYVYYEHSVRTRSVSLTPIYQFFHNTWVHPFVGAGVDFDRDSRRTEAQVRTFVSSPPTSTNTIEPLPDVVDRTVHVRAALASGVKVYVTRRAFLRTDVRVSMASRVQAVRWRVGGGIDF